MQPKHYHFIGIGGIGMSALAFLLIQKGFSVSGSDLAPSELTERLKKQGAQVFPGHAANRIGKNMAVVYSSAVAADNPELKQAQKQNLKIYHRSEILKTLIAEKEGILVAGTHGKTTSSALLAFVLEQAGMDISYAIGGICQKRNARAGQGKYFVAEADESDGSFLNYRPSAAIVTNIENDHLEYWKTFANLQKGFQKFIDATLQNKTLQHNMFWCLEDPALARIMKGRKALSYGFQKTADLQAKNVRYLPFAVEYTLVFENKEFRVNLSLPGRHNVLNSLAVFGMALSVGASPEQINTAFQNFPGIERRMQKIGEKEKILFLGDYGHHPSEIKTVLRSLKKTAEYGKTTRKKIICVFQPHRYSRTKQLFSSFAAAFQDADELIVTDIYSAFEKKIDISAKMLADAIGRKQDNVFYIEEKKLFSFLKNRLQQNQIVLFLGAGNIFEKGRDFVSGC